MQPVHTVSGVPDESSAKIGEVAFWLVRAGKPLLDALVTDELLLGPPINGSLLGVDAGLRGKLRRKDGWGMVGNPSLEHANARWSMVLSGTRALRITGPV